MTAYKGFQNYLHDNWVSAELFVKDKPDLMVIEDPITGYPQVITKEQGKRMAEQFEACKPKLDPNFNINHKFMVFGTGGGMDNSNLEELFYKG